MMSDAFAVSLVESSNTCGEGLYVLGMQAVERANTVTAASPGALFGMLDMSSILLPRLGSVKPRRRTYSSRAKLERAFISIDVAIPRLLGGHAMTPCFWAQLGDVVAKTMGCTNSDDHEWILERLRAILAIHGITQG